jgi:hypothetical protein
MKMLTVEHNPQSNGMIASRALGISNKAAAKIIYQILTGQVSDKIAYPIREYATNAWEVSPAGKPFEVDLPSRFSPRIRFRDYGPGLSHTFMMNRYGVIGDSTKDQDDNAVGGWGNGSKSALAYLMREDGAGSYTVRSFYRGVVSTYTIGMNPHGGVLIECLDQSPTDEPTGLEVSFPVREEDILKFNQRAAQVLWSFHPWPVIRPMPDWKQPKVRMTGEGWTVYDPSTVPWSGPHVRMGPVMYPINLHNVEGDFTGFLQSSDCVLFDAPIGSLKVTSSREQLAYEERTKRTLKALIEKYEGGFVQDIQNKVETAGSYFEACQFFHDMTASFGDYRRGKLYGKISWRGHMVWERFGHKAMALNKGWTTFSKFDADGVVFTHQLTDRPIVVEYSGHRSLERFEQAGLIGQHLLWVRVKRRDLPKFLDQYGLAKDDITVLDEVKLPEGPARQKNMRRRKTLEFATETGGVRQETKQIDVNAERPVVRAYTGYWTRRGDLRFYIAPGQNMELRDLRRLNEKLHELGITIEDDVLVMTENEDLQDNWTWLGTYLAEQLKEHLDVTQISGVTEKNTNHLSSELRAIGYHYRFDDAPADLKAFTDDVKALYQQLSGTTRSATASDIAYSALKMMGVNPLEGVALPECPVVAMEARWESIQKEHPILDYILDHNSYGGDRGQQMINAYIQLLNK